MGLVFRGPDLKKNPEDFIRMGLLSFLIHDVDGVGLQGQMNENMVSYCSNYGFDSSSRLSQMTMGVKFTGKKDQIE
jgi:hypothetical protein